jgi:hypothetical protein
VQDELAVRQVVQMVVWWGIVPCLDEGVGIPLAQRLQNASACTCITCSCTHARAISNVLARLFHSRRHVMNSHAADPTQGYGRGSVV